MTVAEVDAIDQALDALFDAYWPIQPQMGRSDTDILSELPEAAALRELSLQDRAEAATRAVERTSRAWRDWTKSDIKATWKDPAYISVKAFHFAASRLMASKLPLTQSQVARILKATAAANQWNDSFFPIGRIVKGGRPARAKRGAQP